MSPCEQDAISPSPEIPGQAATPSHEGRIPSIPFPYPPFLHHAPPHSLPAFVRRQRR
jgi:hypothetical protein